MAPTITPNVSGIASYLTECAFIGAANDASVVPTENSKETADQIADISGSEPLRNGDASDKRDAEGHCAEVIPLSPFKRGSDSAYGSIAPMHAHYTFFHKDAQPPYAQNTILNVAMDRLSNSSIAISGAIVVIGAELYVARPIQTVFRKIMNQPGDWSKKTPQLLSAIGAQIEYEDESLDVSRNDASNFQMLRIAPSKWEALREPAHPYIRQYWLRMGEEGQLIRAVIPWTDFYYRQYRDSQISTLKKAYENANALLVRLQNKDRSAVDDAVGNAILVETLARELDIGKYSNEPSVLDGVMAKALDAIWQSTIQLISEPNTP